MKINQTHYRTIWLNPKDRLTVQIIDQRFLPHEFIIETIQSVDQMAAAIAEMHIRGAGAIGAAAGYGMYLAALEEESSQDPDKFMADAANILLNTRPTAVNLERAINRQIAVIDQTGNLQEKAKLALLEAEEIANEDAEFCRRIGLHGLSLIEDIANKKNGGTVNILTHCNAGWLAFVDYGSATAPIYAAHDKGIDIHVWVDETRPRNQGARLTAWELKEHGVPHTIIADNTGGHLMQTGQVDIVITGSDRTTYAGDVGNKIGTYLKALAAKDNNIPFYAALPSSTFDWKIRDGIKEIPIEKRSKKEVKYIRGLHDGQLKEVLLTPMKSDAVNYAFDVTPARLVTGLITERGICEANENSILQLFPEFRSKTLT